MNSFRTVHTLCYCLPTNNLQCILRLNGRRSTTDEAATSRQAVKRETVVLIRQGETAALLLD